MGYRRFTVGILLLLAALFPIAAGAEETASTSTGITLHIPPRVEFRKSAAGDRQRLCLRHIPARHYGVRITNESGESEYREGNAGSYCLPPGAIETAGSVLIVAE